MFSHLISSLLFFCGSNHVESVCVRGAQSGTVGRFFRVAFSRVMFQHSWVLSTTEFVPMSVFSIEFESVSDTGCSSHGTRTDVQMHDVFFV